MKAYRKKPVVILAEQWFKPEDVPEANIKQWPLTADSKLCKYCGHQMKEHGECPTLEGVHIVCPGDYIIRGIQGEYYPCKPDIFEETYEPVRD